MKRCFRCGEEKPLEAFYPHPQTRCKACVCADRAEYRRRNLAAVRERERTREDRPERVALRAASAGRYDHAASAREWINRNPEKRRALIITSNALANGRLVRPARCERCGEPAGKLRAHHPDFTAPLMVIWLCLRCWGLRLRAINAERRRGEKPIGPYTAQSPAASDISGSSAE
jgi:hypothetical protein